MNYLAGADNTIPIKFLEDHKVIVAIDSNFFLNHIFGTA
jgi:hypothetical protein